MPTKKNNGFKAKISKDGRIIFTLKTAIYPLEAIYNTASFFIDRAYLHLDGDVSKEIIVNMKAKEKLDAKALSLLEGEFFNELLNNVLRLYIAASNQKIREFVVGTALVSCLPTNMLMANLPNNALNTDNLDWRDDPLGIAIPWEEKKAKKKK